MAGLTQAMEQQALDNVFPTSASTDNIAYSENGTSESASLGRTAVGAAGWAAATAAVPSVKQNNTALTSAAASAGATITHFAIYSAASGGTQKTPWTVLDTARTLLAGDQLTWAINTCKITLS